MALSLDEQYQKIIDDQRAHLLKLQEDFNKKCDAAKEKTTSRLKEIPAENKEARAAVLKEQKAELTEALRVLKTAINESTRDTMKHLEEIVREKEKNILAGLEKELEAL